MKAFLQESDVQFPKTHDLSTLLNLALSVEPTWTSLQADLNALSAFAVEYRYPGEASDDQDAKEAFQKCESVRQTLRAALKL